MEQTLSGGCQCGAVRFKVSGQLGKASICHCRMCQKAFGNFAAPFVNVPLSNVNWTRGEPTEFRSSASGSRGFCNKCGTPLTMESDGDSTIDIAMGAFDNPNEVGPLISQIGIESRVSWFFGMEKLPEKPANVGRSPEELDKLRSLQHPDHDTPNWPS
jgi:hypothetical protein